MANPTMVKLLDMSKINLAEITSVKKLWLKYK